MLSTIFKLFHLGLRIADVKIRRKYSDRVYELEKAHDEEYAKPIDERSDDELDKIRLALDREVDAFERDVMLGVADEK